MRTPFKPLNIPFHVRTALVRPPVVKACLDIRYVLATATATVRGWKSVILGQSCYEGRYRPLLIGRRTRIELRSGGRIYLLDSRNPPQDPANPLVPLATSIGCGAHWIFMNPPVGRRTHIRALEGASLLLGANTLICAGAYISIWPDSYLKLEDSVYLGHNIFISTRHGLTIGRGTVMSRNVSIMDYAGHPVFERGREDEEHEWGGKGKQVIIEDNVLVGMGATILKGVRVGKGAIIGGQSCVVHDVPEYTMVAGNPAKIVREGVSWKAY